MTAAGSAAGESPRGPYRQELLYALRRSQETDGAVCNPAAAPNAAGTVLELPKVELPKTARLAEPAARGATVVVLEAPAGERKTIPTRVGPARPQSNPADWSGCRSW